MDFSILNDKQNEAVLCTNDPLLVIAGAGSGKTRVITYKIAYFIESGVSPFNILAITFTNKAADEMHERIQNLLGTSAYGVFCSTFHKMCSRILRNHIDRIGFSTNFSIYDTDDSKALIKSIIKSEDLDSKVYKEKPILSKISSYKNKGLNYESMNKDAYDEVHKKYAHIFKMYTEKLAQNNALDFDDLLLKTVELFKSCPDVLEKYNNRFKYILVDEYQDTNLVQFELVKLLSKKSVQLCVVGDDDQSIYKFRGADIQNILSFEEHFSNAKTIKLEQNYRSTQNILSCANSVIENNAGRKNKILWTNNKGGSKVRYKIYSSQLMEGIDVINQIKRNGNYKNTVVLYRTNAQSRIFEEQCIKNNIPYRLVGGVNFYQRREIKDVLSYLRLVNNTSDDVSLERIINIPKRSIGNATINKLKTIAAENNITLYECLSQVDNLGLSSKCTNAIINFYSFIESLKNESDIKIMIERIKNETGYAEELLSEDGEIEGKERLDNIDEFMNNAVEYMNTTDAPTLNEFLANVSLVADVDKFNENEETLTLMTLHSSKGLEFTNVYLVGLVDGLFPSYMAITSTDASDLEEERRLCYVGFTRAKEHLYISTSRQRLVNGSIQPCEPSRFISEIDSKFLDTEYDDSISMPTSNPRSPRSFAYYDEDYGFSRNFRKNTGFEKYNNTSFHTKDDLYSNPSNLNINVNLSKTITEKYQKGINIQKASSLDYTTGDKVSHVKFGIGTVTHIEDVGKDYEVTVLFDNFGEKLLFAGFAKLKKIQ